MRKLRDISKSYNSYDLVDYHVYQSIKERRNANAYLLFNNDVRKGSRAGIGMAYFYTFKNHNVVMTEYFALR